MIPAMGRSQRLKFEQDKSWTRLRAVGNTIIGAKDRARAAGIYPEDFQLSQYPSHARL